jgi:endonuclease YncB( thermonuclease family)
MKTLTLLSSLLIAIASAEAAPMGGKVVGVKSGNALEILSEGKVYDVKLHGIACPARGESFGKTSRKAAAAMAFMNEVTFEIVSAESDGSFIGKVELAGGRSLSAELIKAGMAWWNSESNPEEKGLAKLEKEARDTYMGLWATPEDETDTDWRREVLVQRENNAKGVASLLSSN